MRHPGAGRRPPAMRSVEYSRRKTGRVLRKFPIRKLLRHPEHDRHEEVGDGRGWTRRPDRTGRGRRKMEGRRRDRTPAVLPQPAMTTPGDCPLAEVTSSSRFEQDAEYGPRVPTRSIGALAGGGGPRRQGAGGPSARGILRASSWAATGVTCAPFYWGTWAAAEAELFDW